MVIWSIKLLTRWGAFVVVSVDVVGADLEQDDVWLGGRDGIVDDTSNLRDLPPAVSFVLLWERLVVDVVRSVRECSDGPGR